MRLLSVVGLILLLATFLSTATAGPREGTGRSGTFILPPPLTTEEPGTVDELLARSRKATVWVKNASDFLIYTKSHQWRLPPLGKAVIQQFPIDFAGVDPKVFEAFMKETHDRVKYDTSASFRKEFGIPLDEPLVLDELYKSYTINFRELEAANPRAGSLISQLKENSAKLLNKMMEVDKRVALKWFAQHKMLLPNGEPNDVAKKILRLESIVDKVDRGSCPITSEEFGRAMDPASKFMKNPEDQKIALFLETRYTDIVKYYTYDLYKTAQRGRYYGPEANEHYSAPPKREVYNSHISDIVPGRYGDSESAALRQASPSSHCERQGLVSNLLHFMRRTPMRVAN